MASRTWSVLVVAMGLAGCEEKQTYKTTMEVVQVERFGATGDAVDSMAIELRYAECPGDGRRVVRANADFVRCLPGLKAGDRLEAKIVARYVSERGSYRSDIVELGHCAMKLDPKEEANYEMMQTCTDLKTSGTVVGVHCDRTRSKELVAKCPWLRRR
jgi:hypothetical protein